MSEARDMLVATAERLFQDYCTPELLKASNKGPLSPNLWSAITLVRYGSLSPDDQHVLPLASGRGTSTGSTCLTPSRLQSQLEISANLSDRRARFFRRPRYSQSMT